MNARVTSTRAWRDLPAASRHARSVIARPFVSMGAAASTLDGRGATRSGHRSFTRVSWATETHEYAWHSCSRNRRMQSLSSSVHCSTGSRARQLPRQGTRRRGWFRIGLNLSPNRLLSGVKFSEYKLNPFLKGALSMLPGRDCVTRGPAQLPR